MVETSQNVMPNRRINLAFMTTLSEIIDDEGVGRHIIDSTTGESFGIRRGVIDYFARQLASNNCFLAQHFAITAIIVNDGENEVKAYWKNNEGFNHKLKVPHYSNENTEWIELEKLVHILPSSSWRAIKIPRPEKATSSEIESTRARKAQLKNEYEQNIVKILQSAKVDILLTVCYMNIIGSVLLSAFKNRIINLHPAISSPSDPCRLPGLSPTRDALTRAKYGFVIVEDHKSIFLDGKKVSIEYEGETVKAIEVPEQYRDIHGITAHLVSAKVDEGPPILTEKYNLQDHFSYSAEQVCQSTKPLLTLEGIRNLNYNLMPTVLEKALLKYVQQPEIIQLLKK